MKLCNCGSNIFNNITKGMNRNTKPGNIYFMIFFLLDWGMEGSTSVEGWRGLLVLRDGGVY